jgi:hypothetical protein
MLSTVKPENPALAEAAIPAERAMPETMRGVFMRDL